MPRIALLGVGLIGGSLGLAWHARRSDGFVTGFDEPHVLDAALELGAIDARAATPEAAVRDADIVVLAAPLAASLRLLDAIALHLRPGTVVTDVGSVKQPIARHAAGVLPEHVAFVGGHPMAGSEKSGVAHADAFLFENATYVLCPPEGMPDFDFSRDYALLIDLVQATGARVLVLDAARHDRIAATVSHLPQLLAVALMHYAAEHNQNDDAFLQLAAGGFRDMTRIAASPFGMWRDVLVANHGAILDALSGFAADLRRLQHRLIEEDLDALEDLFTQSRTVRTTIPRDSKGFLHPLADVYVFAEDRPGELLALIQTLYDAELNIKDIELLKIREGTGGAFRMSFATDALADAAVAALSRHGKHAYRL